MLEVPVSWDKQVTRELMEGGLTWEQARFVVGVIAEQRQIADLQGFKRGYNNGYEDAQKKESKMT